MREIFLSASVPETGRGDFYESANPFLIQFAVRELVTVCLGRRRIIWGGHPSITPMVHAVCQDFGLRVSPPVVLYQSAHFEGGFPEENKFFETVRVAAGKEREESLRNLRSEMLSRPIEYAVFIGGMEGIFDEYEMCLGKLAPGHIVAVGAPGGAARQLSGGFLARKDGDRIDFARLFYERLGISPTERRELERY